MAAANLLAEYCNGDAKKLATLIAAADRAQTAILYPLVEVADGPVLRDTLVQITREKPADDHGETARVVLGQRRAAAALTLLRLGERTASFDALRIQDDPESLTQFVHRSREWQVPPQTLWECVQRADAVRQSVNGAERKQEDRVLFGLLLAMGEYSLTDFSAETQRSLVPLLADWYARDPSSAIHGASGWLWRQCGQVETAKRVDETPVDYDPEREWFTLAIDVQTSESSGLPKKTLVFHMTFVVFPPGEYLIGSPDYETDRNVDESRYWFRLEQPLAILDREITRAEFVEFDASYADFDRGGITYDHAVTGPNWYDCVRFCRWLTEQCPGFSEDDQCYANPALLDATSYPPDPIPAADGAPSNWPMRLDRHGFRLPCEEEWELACRSGMTTCYSFGSDTSRLASYSWCMVNSDRQVQVPRSLRPTPRGVFDMHGNAVEWCHGWYSAYGSRGDQLRASENRTIRGGCFVSSAANCRSADRYWFHPAFRADVHTFRLAIVPSRGKSSSSQPTGPLEATGKGGR